MNRPHARRLPILGCCAALAGGAVAQGEPQPDIAPVVIDNVGVLDQADVATTDLELKIRSPDELAPIARLTRLRRLALSCRSAGPGRLGVGWLEAGHDALAPLRACRSLRSLSVGYFADFDPACLRVVGELPDLDDLQLTGTRHLLDRRLVDVLGKLGLRRLRLAAVRVSPDAFGALCELPLLRSLVLDMPLHIARSDLTSLARLRGVERLGLRNVGSRLVDSLQRSNLLPGDEAGGQVAANGPGIRQGLVGGEPEIVLDAAAMRAIATLPRLRELDLTGSYVSDEVMAMLPERLTRLDLTRVIGLTKTAVSSLRRITGLRHLTLDSQPGEFIADLEESDAASLTAAFAELLPQLDLTNLKLRGGVAPELSRALASCRKLRGVQVYSGPKDPLDVAFLAELPDLERVELSGAAGKERTRVQQLVGDEVEVVSR